MNDTFLGKLGQLLAYDKANPLLFNTGLFMLLFVGLLLVYQAMRRWRVAKMLIIIAFSLYFYYKSSAEYCFILLGVCVSDFVLGLWMGHTPQRWLRKVIVALNVVVNVGMLAYFKYFNLLYETFASITGTNFDALDIILPAGISFFTFRSISYIVDIYRGRVEPCTNFLNYCFFLTFFPPLLAGPVVRAKDMLPQIAANPVATRQMVSEGLFLIIAGLIKKVVVADYISGNFVSGVFENPSLYTGFQNVMGAIGYAVQLYCDFSGYSDMAIGIALLLGFRLKDNFNSPFKSQSPSEFWKRWHISLSSWLMDYLYIPLGGNRKGEARKHVNLMATMTIGGLWHGATWMFVIWGAYNGLLLVMHKLWQKLRKSFAPKSMDTTQKPQEKLWYRVLCVIGTFIMITIGFMFFAAPSLSHLGDMFTAIFTNFHPEVAPQFMASYLLVNILIVGALVIHWLPDKWQNALKNSYISMPMVLQALVLGIVIFIAIQMRQTALQPFVYLSF